MITSTIKLLKKEIIFIFLLLIPFNLFSKTARYQTENLTINLNYNDIVVPGDAIFVRMNISTPKHKKNKNDIEKKAALELYLNDKKVDSSPFYIVNKNKKQNSTEYLCGIPVSPWWEKGNFYLNIIFELSDDETKKFKLPLVFQKRDFDTEIIDLDEVNTAIKTNKKPEVTAQIDKLNEILKTITPANIYTTKKFTVPTQSTKFSAHYGDRRTYSYSNGKTSTSLHYGNDYAVPEGSNVYSCAEGKVVLAENRTTTGYSIVVEHLPGLYSLYYHLSELKVKEGDMVRQNEIIGKSGNTGLSTGPHLHWEVRLNSQAVRPEFFLNDFTFENN